MTDKRLPREPMTNAEYTRRRLEMGNIYAYDEPDSQKPPKAVDWAHYAARGILYDMNDRVGIKHEFARVDQDTRREIVEETAELIRAAYDAAPPSHDEGGVPYVDVAAEDVPEWAEYLATDCDEWAGWHKHMPYPIPEEGEWFGSTAAAAPPEYAITDQPWFLTLRRIRRV